MNQVDNQTALVEKNQDITKTTKSTFSIFRIHENGECLRQQEYIFENNLLFIDILKNFTVNINDVTEHFCRRSTIPVQYSRCGLSA